MPLKSQKSKKLKEKKNFITLNINFLKRSRPTLYNFFEMEQLSFKTIMGFIHFQSQNSGFMSIYYIYKIIITDETCIKPPLEFDQ